MGHRITPGLRSHFNVGSMGGQWYTLGQGLRALPLSLGWRSFAMWARPFQPLCIQNGHQGFTTELSQNCDAFALVDRQHQEDSVSKTCHITAKVNNAVLSRSSVYGLLQMLVTTAQLT